MNEQQEVAKEIDRLLNHSSQRANLISSIMIIWFIVFVFLTPQPYNIIYFWINLIFLIIAVLAMIFFLRNNNHLRKLFDIRDNLASEKLKERK